jgi:ribosome-associated translation inhibitor RaiA
MKPNLREIINQQTERETNTTKAKKHLAKHLNNLSNNMKIIMRYHGLNAHAVWQGLVETQLRRLQALAKIASARITLERQRGAKPIFRVLALLEVPGPDFHAEASDHTLQAALLKVVTNLERQIRSRIRRRLHKRKTNAQLGLLPRGSLSLSGART